MFRYRFRQIQILVYRDINICIFGCFQKGMYINLVLYIERDFRDIKKEFKKSYRMNFVICKLQLNKVVEKLRERIVEIDLDISK